MASGFVKAELSTCRHGRPQVTCRLLYKSVSLSGFQKGDYESMRKDTLEFAKENISMVTRILVQYRRTLIC